MDAFSIALNYSNQIDCKNGKLLRGMIYAYMARVANIIIDHTEKSTIWDFARA